MTEDVIDCLDVSDIEQAKHDADYCSNRDVKTGNALTPGQEKYAEIVQAKIVKGTVTNKDLAFFEDMVNNSDLHACKIMSLLQDIEEDPQLNEDVRNKMGLAKLHIDLHRSNSNNKKNDATVRSMTMKDINQMMKAARQKQMSDTIPKVKVLKGGNPDE